MFDAKPPAGSELPGGNGIPFDWHALAGLDRNVDYLLSGGLNAANIGEALRLNFGFRSVNVEELPPFLQGCEVRSIPSGAILLEGVLPNDRL